jgi:hypothetical protein
MLFFGYKLNQWDSAPNKISPRNENLKFTGQNQILEFLFYISK